MILPLWEGADLIRRRLLWQQSFMQMPARFILTWTVYIRQIPVWFPKAKKLKAITYDEMLDLAALGAGVLHNRSVEMAKKYGVRLIVRSSLNESEGNGS